MADDLRSRLVQFLVRAAEQIRGVGLPNELAITMEVLSSQVMHPCTVAVVGRMKAGKSTFINALLKENVAVVAATEATATINYIRYGVPNADTPVCCHWRNGQITQEPRSFMDQLQGNDVATLRLADNIDHLEYILPNDFLREAILVDTPGTGTVVSEHQQATAEFLKLRGHLRERHNKETNQLGSNADAVVYLIGEVARTTDDAFLNEFREVTGGNSRAFNAVGVMAKIDLQEAVLKRREELSGKIAGQLEDSLNTVIPVSAGLQRFLDHSAGSNHAVLERILASLKQIPAAMLENKLLKHHEFFSEMEIKDCPVSVATRVELLSRWPWTVFTTVVRTAIAVQWNLEATIRELCELAGFERLRRVLDEHLFHRGQILRCYRVLVDAKKVVEDLQFRHLRLARKHDDEMQLRHDRFVDFVRQANGDPETQRELLDYLRGLAEHGSRAEQIDTLRKTLDRELAGIQEELEGANDDFIALQLLESHKSGFSLEELDELRALFGRYGLDSNNRVRCNQSSGYLGQREQHWRQTSWSSQSDMRRMIAHHALRRYGMLLFGLSSNNDN